MYNILTAIFAFILSISSSVMPLSEMKPVNPNPIKEINSEQQTRIMTYNLKVSGTGQYAPTKRAPSVVKSVLSYMPDSVGFEEASPEWMRMLKEQLTGYAYVGIGRDRNNTGEASPVFYLEEKYDLVDSGTFWLSETPEKVSRGWDAFFFHRVCTYAVLKNKETGFTYAHFNAHFDHIGVVARNESAALVCRKIAEICPDIPVLFSGDLNDDEGGAMYERILESGMKDTKFLAKDTMDSGTYHGYSEKTEEERTKPIDFIFVNAYHADVLKYKVDLEKFEGIYPSDHHPVITDLLLVNGGE